MKLFFSGTGKGVVEMDGRLGTPRYRLFSCHGAYLNYAKKTTPLVATIDNDFEIMYDSGAFTAWSKGEEVTLQHLIDVYGALLDEFSGTASAIWLINLDKIPGSPGRTATTAELEEAIKISDENYHILRDKFGDIVLPVFHQNESAARLQEVCAMTNYICVSPRNDLPEASRRRWAAEVHTKLPAGISTHGLAATGYPMMSRVPWGSVDSASWIMLAAYGKIYRSENLQAIAISAESPAKHIEDAHFDNISPYEQQQLVALMDAWGFTVEGLQNDFVERSIWNRLMMSSLYRSITVVNVKIQDTLFPL